MVDSVVSGLVLNFIPDLPEALAEMIRVTHSGGTIAAYVWDYAGKMDVLRYFWDAALAFDPGAAQLDEGARFSICRPEALSDLFIRARLKQVEVRTIDIPARFNSFEEYWRPFTGGQGPAPSYLMSLDEAGRSRLNTMLRERVHVQSDGSIAMTARAWAVRSIIPW